MVKIDIISGFLGAGKTTLIKKLLKDGFQGEQVVLIENEFGEIGIDGGFLKEAGIQIREMNSGCICCSLVGDFGTSLKEVVTKYNPDRILIEPSGVGKLSDVIKAVQGVQDEVDIKLNSYTTVVDAKKCKMYMKNFGEFFDNQIQYAGAIIMSRTDIASEKKVQESLELLRSLNKDAAIITTPIENLDGKKLVEVMEHPVSLEQEMLEEEHEHHHHHDGECGCGHDHEEHEHHHHHDGECGCGHDHEEHEHHHHDGECGCGHDHEEHEHHHHDHDEHEHEHCHEHGHEAHGHGHEGHHHAHHHHHRSLTDVTAIIDGSQLSGGAKRRALAIFTALAAAEAKAHGKTPETVMFHEVGAVDSIVDVCSVAICLDDLSIEDIVVESLSEGHGTIHCAHGLMPIPVPAVVNLCQAGNIALTPAPVAGELVTPTGAAIVAALRTSEHLPARYRIEAVGYGAGKRPYEGCSGTLRCLLVHADA